MRRALRITGWTLGALVLLVLVLVAAILIAGNTAGGRALIERETASLSDGQVRLAGLGGTFPQALDLEELELRDASGVWLVAQHISLRWSPLALLARHVEIARLQLARLDVERRPVTKPSSGSTRLPRVDVEQLAIERLELGPQLAGTRVALGVHGTLHLVSLTDATVQVTARRSDGSGDYELNVRFDPARMDASLKLEEPPGGPLEHLLGYPGLGTLSVHGTLQGPRSAERVELEAGAGDLHAAVRGNLDLNTRSADVDYSIEAPAMTPRPGLSWKKVDSQGHWHGPVSAARADARLRISGLQVPGGAGAAAIDATLGADSGTVTLQAQIQELTIPGPQPRLLASSPVRLEAAIRLSESSRPLQLEVNHQLFALEARALICATPSATFALRLPELTPLAALAGQSISGESELRGTVRQDSATTHLDLDARTELTRGSHAVTGLVGGASRLQLAAALTPRALELERVALSGRSLSFSASGRAERGSIPGTPAFQVVHARYQGRLADVAALTPAAAGDVSFSGTVDGPVKSLAAELRLTANLSVRGTPRQTLEASIKARGLPALTSAQLEARGGFDGAPLALRASLEHSVSGAFHLTVPGAEWRSAHLDGDLTTGADLAPGHGAVRLQIDHLADLSSLTGTSLGGALAASLELRPTRGHTSVQARVDAENLVAADVAASVRLRAEGAPDALGVHLRVHLPNLRGEPASVEAVSRVNLSARELALERVQLQYHGQTLHLLAPARLSFADGFLVDRLELGVQHAVIEIDGRLSPALRLQASVHHVDAPLVNAFVPDTLAQGNLDVDAQLEGTPASPSGLITVAATGVRPGNDAARELHALDLHARVRLADGAAQVDANLSAGQSSQLTLSGTAPLALAGDLSLKLKGQLDAALANPLLEAHGERAAGTITIDATVTGPARSPEVGGTVDLARGEVRDYLQGIHLSDMTAHLTGDHGTLRIARFTARAAPGEVSMTGTIGVLEPKLPVDLHLLAKDARPVTSDILTANLDADIKVTGTLRERMEVSGTINLRRTLIGIPNSLPPNVGVLDVRRPGAAPPPHQRKLVVGLDLKLHAPREVLVQGRGLNAELGGDLHITGTADTPVVSGGFELIRGTFALAGSQLTFTKGEVSFNGAGLKGRINPSLDFTAQSFVVDATETLHITGLADAPQFELSSQPPLPQDEILARLLFGVTASQLSTLQVASIAAGLATLGGVGGSGPNPLARVQKALGLDRLSVGTAASSSSTGSQNQGTSLEAGRYVSSRVFVGAKQSTTGFSQVEVDVDLSKHLKLQTRVGNGSATTQGTTPENDPGSSVGLTYQFEY